MADGSPTSDSALLLEVREYIDYASDSPSSVARLTSLLHSASSSSSPSSSSAALSTLRSLFLPRIAFGTAGLRARMDDGYHHINSVVITQTTQGLVRYLQEVQGPELSAKGVVVGYDGRHHSREWAELTAAIFLSASIPVLLFSAACPTPLVPFAIRQRGLCAGVMITASHNPAADNGYKLYWSNSAQIIPPRDADISRHIAQQRRPWQQYTLNRRHPLLHDRLHDMQERYAELIGEYCWRREHNRTTSLRVTYTAMHGVGAPWAARAFEAFGLPAYIPVPEQIEPDPDFPTVQFPNPEEGAGALSLSFRTADAHGSPLIIANDPDADRLAIAEKTPSGEWVCLNGNQIALLFADWIWRHYRSSHPASSYSSAFMLNSTVSSAAVARMAAREGFSHWETLTGFKWMGNRADELLQQGLTLLFAFEVEIGYLVGDISLDKDGVRCAAIFYELAAQLYNEGSTCMQRIAQLEQRYGHSYMINEYAVCSDPATFTAIFSRIRTMGPGGGYPVEVARHKVASVRDVPLGIDTREADGKSRLPVITDSFMITLRFDGGATLTLRNSGTEPKLKYYIEVFADSKEQAKRKCEAMRACLDELLQFEQNHLSRPIK